MPVRTFAAALSRLGCNSSSVEEMLGNQGVTESNMMQYLGIIEQRAIEVCADYSRMVGGKGGPQTSELDSCEAVQKRKENKSFHYDGPSQ